jgi:hypothetical protein
VRSERGIKGVASLKYENVCTTDGSRSIVISIRFTRKVSPVISKKAHLTFPGSKGGEDLSDQSLVIESSPRRNLSFGKVKPVMLHMCAPWEGRYERARE